MKTAPEEKGDARGHHAWKSALCLGLMVLAVFGAWLAARIIRSHLESSHAAGRNAVVFPGPKTQPTWMPKSPAEVFSRPFAAVGLTRLGTDPGKIPPPSGAKLLYAFQRRRTEETEQQAQYEFPGPADEAVRHYTRVFPAEGFRLLKDAADPTGRRTLVFEKGRIYATVGLRGNLRHAKIVIIVLTVVSPGTPGSKE